MAPVADFVPRGAPAQRCGVQPSPVHCGRNWDSKIREDWASVIGVSRWTVWAGPRRGGVPGAGWQGDRCMLTPGEGDSPGKLSGAGLCLTEASGSTMDPPGSVAKGRFCHCFSLVSGEEQGEKNWGALRFSHAPSITQVPGTWWGPHGESATAPERSGPRGGLQPWRHRAHQRAAWRDMLPEILLAD